MFNTARIALMEMAYHLWCRWMNHWIRDFKLDRIKNGVMTYKGKCRICRYTVERDLK